MPSTANPQHALLALASDIKLSHSVFALPFALLATFLAAGDLPGWGVLGLIVACMFFARTYAMLANRWVDREIDKANPRTAGRAVPSGRVTGGQMMLAMIASGAALVGCSAGFGFLWDNWWPAIFSPAVLIWLGVYGLMKRWTLLCHFFLGGALAISPLAAGLAVRPEYLAEPTLWWLAGFVLLWVGGFDVIYALADMEVDRREGLHSIPAKFGRDGALLLAKVAHVAGFAMLIFAGQSSAALGMMFKIGVGLVGVLLIVEHAAARRGKFNMAFFTLNGVISLILGGLGIADVLMR